MARRGRAAMGFAVVDRRVEARIVAAMVLSWCCGQRDDANVAMGAARGD